MAAKELEVMDLMHNVYFLDCSGRLIGRPVRVPHGQPAHAPAYVPEGGREFLGWSRSTARVMQDIYCVAVTRESTQPAVDEEPECRVLVLELRGQKRASLLPLGNWAKGETLTRDDLNCLHLRHMDKLRPFRCPIVGDTLLAVTDYGVRAFDTSMRHLEGLLELMPMTPKTESIQQRYASIMPAAGSGGLLAREA